MLNLGQLFTQHGEEYHPGEGLAFKAKQTWLTWDLELMALIGRDIWLP